LWLPLPAPGARPTVPRQTADGAAAGVRPGRVALPAALAAAGAFTAYCWRACRPRPGSSMSRAVSAVRCSSTSDATSIGVGLSNDRIRAITDQTVTSPTRGWQNRHADVPGVHPPLPAARPPCRLRQGPTLRLLASCNLKTRLEMARRLLTPAPSPPSPPVASSARPPLPPPPPAQDWRSRLARLTGLDLTTCPRCGARLRSYAFLPFVQSPTPARSPP